MSVDERRTGKRYTLHDLIGAGGMGKVYRAHDMLTDTMVALKQVMIPNEQVITNSTPDPTQQSHMTLATEFRTLSTLRHPHIISVLDYGFNEQQHPYYTMELLENAYPITEIAQHVSPNIKLSLIVKMLQALSYLHRRGILHRDLKPDNVLVTQVNDDVYDVKVLDFGLASTIDIEDRSSNIIGTLAYIAPEILQDQLASRASDLYAVGMIMYEVLAGQYPFDTSQITDLMESILYVRPRIPTPGIDRSIGSILRKLLDKSPAKRPTDAESVLSSIADVAEITLSTETIAVRESFLQSAKFVGRESEITTLTDAVFDTKEQVGSLWLVSGESGVGKSRLLDELRTIGLVEGALVLRGQAISDGSMSYQVWREVVRRLLLSTSITDEQASVLKSIVPDIERILNRSLSDAPQLSESAQKERLTDTIIQVISQHTRPTLILLEDLHWSVDSLDPLIQLSNRLANLPVCIVGTYRTDEQLDLSETLPDATELRLPRLNRDEIEALSVSMVGDAAQQTGVIDLVERETEGNTFFIVEVMRALAEDAGQLDNIGRMTLPASVLTGGINTVIERRMSRVPSQYYGLLSLAAVIGRQLDLTVLQHILTTYDDFGDFMLDAWLGVCESAAVISVQDENWQFSHDKLREHLLQKLDDRAPYHQIVAEAIEAVYPDDESRFRALTEHWLQIPNFNKALQYGIPAAKQMKDVSNYRAAIDLLHGIHRRWNQGEIDQTTQCDFFFRLGELQERVGENEIAKQHFEQSYQLATDLKDNKRLIDALWGKGLVAYNTSQYAPALQYLEDALAMGADHASPESLAYIYKNISNIYSQQDELERSNIYIKQALDISRANNIQIEVAGSLNNLGVNEYMLGDYDAARDYYQQALDVYLAIGYRSGIALCYSNLGDVAFDKGMEKQLEYYEKGLAIYQDTGNQWGISLCLENAASTYYMLNHYNQAIDMLRQALKISRKLGNLYAVQHELMDLGFMLCLQDDPEGADDYFNESLKIAADLELNTHRALCLAYSAFNDIALDKLDEATVKLGDAIVIIQASEANVFMYEVLGVYAHLLICQDNGHIGMLLAIFLLSQSALEDITRRLIVQPIYDQLKSTLSDADYQEIEQQAQTLDTDAAVRLIRAGV